MLMYNLKCKTAIKICIYIIIKTRLTSGQYQLKGAVGTGALTCPCTSWYAGDILYGTVADFVACSATFRGGAKPVVNSVILRQWTLGLLLNIWTAIYFRWCDFTG